MKETEQVESLLRGLQLLELAIAMRGGTAAELADATGFTRQTVYRIADTLVSEGLFVRKGGRYEPTQQTRALSEGYAEPAWIAAQAIPPIRKLGHMIFWPLMLATFAGSHMLVRFTTDDESPYAIDTIRAGVRAMITTTAAGRLYLAYCPPLEAEHILAATLPDAPDGGGRFVREGLLAELPEIRAKGFSMLRRRDGGFYHFAVPILTRDGFLASITLRILTSAMRPATAEARYLPLLKGVAAEIGSAIDGTDASGVKAAVAAS